jgi:hypothetical protein
MFIARPARRSGGAGRSARDTSHGLPKRPRGRNTSTAAITTNSTTSVSFESPAAMHSALISRREEGARDAAHAADHHHHESVGDRREVERQLRGLARDLERAGEPRERRAQREHPGEQPFLVDAQRGGHIAILGRGADQPAPAGAVQQQPKRPHHRRADRDQREVVFRERRSQDLDRAAQPRRARSEQVFRSPEREYAVLDHQREREGCEQLQQLGRAVEAPQDRGFRGGAEGADRERRGDHAAPEAGSRDAERPDETVGGVDAQHVQRAVGEIHDARYAEDQRQPRGHQEERGGARQPVEELDGNRRHRDHKRGRTPFLHERRHSYSGGRSFFTSASAGRNFAPSA